MQITIDIADDIYRMIESRAGVSGITVGQLIEKFIECGIGPRSGETTVMTRRIPPPVIIPPCGELIPAISRNELTHMEEDDEADRGGLFLGTKSKDSGKGESGLKAFGRW